MGTLLLLQFSAFTEKQDFSMPELAVHTNEILEQGFTDFLSTRINDPKSEYYIPTAVNQEIDADRASVLVIETTSTWFGVTYQEDKPIVKTTLKKLTEDKKYPSPLF